MISSPEPAAGPSCPHAGTANAAETAHVTSAKDLTSLINLSLHFIVLLIFAWKKPREARLLSTRIIADLIFSVKPKLVRSEEHTSELQSLMRISYAVFCLTKKKQNHLNHI